MKSKTSRKQAIAAEAARLVARLVTLRSNEAERDCHRFAAQSTRHLRELLQTLRFWNKLDVLKSARHRQPSRRRNHRDPAEGPADTRSRIARPPRLNWLQQRMMIRRLRLPRSEEE